MLSKCWQWLVQERHQYLLKKSWDATVYAFTDHPHSAGETYWQHFWFTMKMAMRFLKIAAAIIIHGVFPFLCMRTASNEVKRIYPIMVKRTPVTTDVAHTNKADIAIIGGGFTGAITLAQLIKQATHPLSLAWFGQAGQFGAGVAYGTQDPLHQLNVRASNMGAWADDPQDFWNWLQTDAGKSTLKRFGVKKKTNADSFVPRVVYNAYIQHILDEAYLQAAQKGITLQQHHAHAHHITSSPHSAHELEVAASATKDGQAISIQAKQIVLATGNQPPRLHGFIDSELIVHPSYIHDVWSELSLRLQAKTLQQFDTEDEIVLIGTGLTAVDTILTLTERGFKGKITAISRGGWLPHVHDEPKQTAYPVWSWLEQPENAPKTALGLLVGLRQEVRKAEQQDYNWRRVIDSLRPVTQTLWQHLPLAEKQRFLKRLSTLWGIHRHRMAPEIAQRISALQAEGKIVIASGRINSITEASEGLHVNYNDSHNKNVLAIIYAKMLVNCSGPDYTIRQGNNALLADMCAQGLIDEHPLGIGVDMTRPTTDTHSLAAQVSVLGTLCVGELFECTAVPELRKQVQDTACRVLNAL